MTSSLPGAARVWLEQLRVLVVKELKQLLKDRALFAYTVFIFTLDIALAAGASSIELRRAPLAVHDLGHAAVGRELIGRFQPPYFRIESHVSDARDAAAQLDRGEVRAVLALTTDFDRDLASGRQAEVQLLVDTAQAIQGFLVASYAERIAAELGDEWTRRSLERQGIDPQRLPAIVAAPRYAYNPTLNEIWFNTVSEWLTMLTIAAVVLPAAALVRERERGTVEQLLVAPLTSLQVVLSKVLAMVLVMLAGTAVAVFGVMHFAYGVPMRGDVGLFFAVTALFTMSCAGVGIVASGFARNSGQMSLIVILIVVPMIMLSGTWNMVESMPGWLQALTELSPLRHFIVLAYGLLIRGAPIETLAPALLSMLAIGSALLAVGVLQFRRQFR
ncbi:MAG: ABC transporter permease [Burkholderiaceae bacterium]|nr:ABC transporter permease [Burkholderiaceae bacterium]